MKDTEIGLLGPKFPTYNEIVEGRLTKQKIKQITNMVRLRYQKLNKDAQVCGNKLVNKYGKDIEYIRSGKKVIEQKVSELENTVKNYD
jgi:hypothetical protein